MPTTPPNEPETIELTPNWANMRAWVEHVAKTDLVTAHNIAAQMGTEAPTLPALKHFNIVARYTDHDGGVYEWQGVAADAADAERRAQRQAREDNEYDADGEPMLEPSTSGGMSVVDISEKVALDEMVTATLRQYGRDQLASRFEQSWRRS